MDGGLGIPCTHVFAMSEVAFVPYLLLKSRHICDGNLEGFDTVQAAGLC